MKSITLEMSLKPFRQTDDKYIYEKVKYCFEQWKGLLKDVSEISIMLWCGDGSELFDYKGNPDDRFEWAYFIGGANQREDNHSALDPQGVGLHTRNYLYMENPPEMTYAILKNIVSTIKQVGKEIFGEDKTILVGETVDVGPEFAISDFKYKRHNELCTGGAMGKATMLCAYEKMHADTFPYAAYPEGVPEGEPFGTFFGKQSQIFLSDMGFDYIWFSNGMGFGRETWASTGATFDGEKFDGKNLESVKTEVLDFWKLFRKECPHFPIRTRGTNMTLGVDYATDAVPLQQIYELDADILPPPNSPWAALDGNFGLELAGYMSRISGVDDKDYLFRFYLHDIWWANSPWYDRYNSKPHDIYMPLATCMIDSRGNITKPSHMHILSVDNCFGDLPDLCAYESIPHFLKAFKESPDAPSPVMWVYPFEEYCNSKSETELAQMYGEDWFIAQAINFGFPLSGVTSTSAFINHDKNLYKASVIVTPVPKKGTAFEKAILQYAKNGGKVIFYGSAELSSEEFRSFMGLEICNDGISGEVQFYENGKNTGKLKIHPLICGGTVHEKATGDAYITIDGNYALATRNHNATWLRGVVSCDTKKGVRLPIGHNDKEYIIFEKYMLSALSFYGYNIINEAKSGIKHPCMMLHRHNNAFIMSAFIPNTTVNTKMRFPFGAPIFNSYEAIIEDGFATYRFPKAERCECRAFVKQDSGIVGCRETAPVSAQFRRTISLYGLENAEVYILAEDYCKDNFTACAKRVGDFYLDELSYEMVEIDGVKLAKFTNLTGELHIRMPFREKKVF